MKVSTSELKNIIGIAKKHNNQKKYGMFNRLNFELKGGELRVKAVNNGEGYAKLGFISKPILNLFKDTEQVNWTARTTYMNYVLDAITGDEVDIEINEARELKIGTYTFCAERDMNHWPTFPEYDKGGEYLLDSTAFEKLNPIVQKKYASSKLEGVFLDADKSKAVACDGYRMFVANILYDGESVAIPPKLVEAFKESNQIKLSGRFHNKIMWAETEHGRHWFKKGDTPYFDWEDIIPQDQKAYVEHDRLELIDKIKELKKKMGKITRCAFKAGEFGYRINDGTMVESKPIDFQSGNDEHVLALNIDYLKEALEDIDSTTVTIQYDLPDDGGSFAHKAVIIKDNNFLALVMPIRY